MSAITAPGEERFLQARVIVPFVLCALIWGSTWLVIKGQLGTVPPSWSVTWRFVISALGMLALALVRGESLRIDRAGLRLALIIGLCLFCCNFQFVYRAEQFITSGLVAVLFALLLVPNAVLARVWLGQPITRGFMIGSAIAVAGIMLLMLHEYSLAGLGTSSGGGKVLLGGGLTILGMLLASVANVAQVSPAARGRPVATLFFWSMGIGACFDFVVAWLLSGPPQFDWSLSYCASTAYLALVGSVLTFPMYNFLLRTLGPGRAAYNGVLVPVVAMLLSTVFEGYHWSFLALAGSALAFAGLLVALRARSPSR